LAQAYPLNLETRDGRRIRWIKSRRFRQPHGRQPHRRTILSNSKPPLNKIPADLKFETALSELETLVARMERGELELEESLEAYQRGASLVQHCQAQLTAAEQKLKIMDDKAAGESA
jgi:exodeoxyribonuclease VII small subunit